MFDLLARLGLRRTLRRQRPGVSWWPQESSRNAARFRRRLERGRASSLTSEL